jgi:hypothetical protein
MGRQVRRIVTGRNAEGHSRIIADEYLPVHPAAGAPLRVGLWLTDRAPCQTAATTIPFRTA